MDFEEDDLDDFLEHFGSSRPVVNRHAKQDAAEYARAQAFYGKGAGTRRKLIKQTVEDKSKSMPGYQTAFHKHLASQTPSKHAEKAVSERISVDRTESGKKYLDKTSRKVADLSNHYKQQRGAAHIADFIKKGM